MAKKKVKKNSKVKKRESIKLTINGSLEDVLKASIKQ